MKSKITVERQRQILAENINKFLRRKGKTQTDMARELGIAPTTVSSWLNCVRYPRIDKIQQMADYFGVYRSDLTEDKEREKVFTSSKYPLYPVSVSAGLPIGIDGIMSDDVETITVPDILMGEYAGNKDIYMLRVDGDSMNNIIPNGSIVVVKVVNLVAIKDGDIVVYSDGNDYAIKRMYRSGDKIIFRPDSDNVEYVDYVTTIDNEDIKIHGKVVKYFADVS